MVDQRKRSDEIDRGDVERIRTLGFRGEALPIPDDYTVRFLEYDKRLNRLPDPGGGMQDPP